MKLSFTEVFHPYGHVISSLPSHMLTKSSLGLVVLSQSRPMYALTLAINARILPASHGYIGKSSTLRTFDHSVDGQCAIVEALGRSGFMGILGLVVCA